MLIQAAGADLSGEKAQVGAGACLSIDEVVTAIVAKWMTCNGRNASISTEPIDPYGAGWTDDGGLSPCAGCRFRRGE